jgi:hypothetical protein
VTGGARAGQIDAATASTLTVAVGGGARIPFVVRDRFELSARADVLAFYQRASHTSADEPAAEVASRWVPGIDALAEGAWVFAGRSSLFLGAGVEAAFGQTDIYVRQVRVASLPPVRGIVALGVRTEF